MIQGARDALDPFNAKGGLRGHPVALQTAAHRQNIDELCSQVNRLVTEELAFATIVIEAQDQPARFDGSFGPRLSEILNLGGFPALTLISNPPPLSSDTHRWMWNFSQPESRYAKAIAESAKTHGVTKLLVRPSDLAHPFMAVLGAVLGQEAKQNGIAIESLAPKAKLKTSDRIFSPQPDHALCKLLEHHKAQGWVLPSEAPLDCSQNAPISTFTDFPGDAAAKGKCWAQGWQMMSILLNAMELSTPMIPKQINRQIPTAASRFGIEFDSEKRPVAPISLHAQKPKP